MANRIRTPQGLSLADSGFPAMVERLKVEQQHRIDAIVSTAHNMELTPIETTHGDTDIAILFNTPELPTLDGLAMPLTPWAHSQLAARVGVPLKYYQRMQQEQPGLLIDNVSTWWKAEPDNRLIRSVRPTFRDASGLNLLPHTVRGYLSDTYRTLDNTDLLPVVLKEAEAVGAQVLSTSLDTERFYIKLVSPRLEGEIKRGDIVQAGAIISNSEVGDGKLAIQPFMYRLECTNGMVSMTKFARVHLGSRMDVGVLARDTIDTSNRAVWLQVRDWLRHAFSTQNLEEAIAAFKGSMGVPVQPKAKLAVANVARNSQLTPVEADAVLERYLRQNDDTMFGLVNAVTYVAHGGGLSYRRQVELEQAGGQLLALPEKEFTRMVATKRSEEEMERVYASAAS